MSYYLFLEIAFLVSRSEIYRRDLYGPRYIFFHTSKNKIFKNGKAFFLFPNISKAILLVVEFWALGTENGDIVWAQ